MSDTTHQLGSQARFPQLEITGGLHHGVRMALEDDEYLVGLNAESDIVLRDDGVVPRHALLRIEGADARIEALGADVTVGTMKLAMGHGCRVRMPVTVVIGSASLQLQPGRGGQGGFAGLRSTMGRMTDHPAKLAGGVIAGALVLVAASHGMQPRTATPVAESTLDQSFSEDRNAVQLNTAEASPSVAKAASEELAGKLKESGLNSIRVNAIDGRVAVDGRLSEQQAPAWGSIQRWFDTKYASTTVLTANVAIGPLAGPAPVRLQAVWFGQRPYIIADNGSRYYEGAVLESGWTVQRIAEDRVILARESETLALTYR